MERKKFIELCQRCAILPNGVRNTKRSVPPDCMVEFEGIKYYPIGYELWFDLRGNPMHTAVIHALNVNSVMRVPLHEVYNIEGGD